MRNEPGYRALRRGRWSEAGRVYLVTSVTAGRRRHFADFATACAACRALRGAFQRNSKLLAWVLMPDHWHGLIELGTSDALSVEVARAKALMAKAAHAIAGGAGRLWMRGFHDRAIRDERELLPAARYLVTNPVRAGLVSRCGDYPFWDAVWLESPTEWAPTSAAP